MNERKHLSTFGHFSPRHWKKQKAYKAMNHAKVNWRFKDTSKAKNVESELAVAHTHWLSASVHQLSSCLSLLLQPQLLANYRQITFFLVLLQSRFSPLLRQNVSTVMTAAKLLLKWCEAGKLSANYGGMTVGEQQNYCGNLLEIKGSKREEGIQITGLISPNSLTFGCQIGRKLPF